MSRDPDETEDDAFVWDAGVHDPSYVDAPEKIVVVEENDDELVGGMSSGLLVTFGVFGGIFLLYTVGWLIAVQRMTAVIENPFLEFMSKLGEFIAIASPAIWFVGVLWLTREVRSFRRIVWMLLGAILLIPLPLLLVSS
ncbi:hypothetical protein BH09ACT1_BH09ACT1_29450 [soil metagenome]